MITGGIYIFALADAARAQDSQPPRLRQVRFLRDAPSLNGS
jgi:hypothetical protein